jgi:hypothetical protein
VVAYCEKVNETPGSIIGEKLLGQISDYYFLKKSCNPWS